jgi:aryl-phospho-beta-D-glucosidase BglC (GH1 family)
LCLNGTPFHIHGATAYGTYSDPATEVALAHQANINVLEIVEFETQYHTLSDTMSAATWQRVDAFIATARQGGLHVILNLSSYGQSLQAANQTPTTTDWNNYLSFIANRVNTVTGVRYRDDPTIAMVEIFGEICYPGESDGTCPAGTTGTTSDMQNFYHRTLTEWHALAPNILISSGGFSHLNSPNSNGIPWQAILSDSANPVCDIEVNSPGDLSGSVNKFTQYCQQLGKPWFLAAWSSCFGGSYPFYTPTDADMAAHAQAMYDLARGGAPATYAAIGSDFWNLRDQGQKAGTCSLSPSFPLSFAVVQRN